VLAKYIGSSEYSQFSLDDLIKDNLIYVYGSSQEERCELKDWIDKFD
jgi:hypothetical protein